MSWLGWLLRALTYAWVLRVPILTGLALMFFPWIALQNGASSYLAGLLDVPDPRAMVLVAFVSLLVAWAATITGRIVLAYGSDRFDLPKFHHHFFPVSIRFWVFGGVMALPVIVMTIWQSAVVSRRPVVQMSVAALVGVLAAGVAFWAALKAAGKLTNKGHAWRTGSPNAVGRRYQAVLEWLHAHPALGEGFVRREPYAGQPHVELLRGHGIAAILAILAGLTFVVAGVITSNLDQPVYISTLTCVLLLLLVLCWTLGFIAFLFDRARVPLFVLLLVAAFFMSFWAATDHFYRTYPRPGAFEPVRPADLLADRQGAPVIVVAASGGGIQAAAWTTRVLTGLDDAARQAGRPGLFARSVRLISAVSGGSVGAMYYVTSHRECGPAGIDPGTERSPVDNAMASSLHAVGWGFVFRDMNITPIWTNPYTDRGLTLEQAWRRDPRLMDDEKSLLSIWRRNIVTRGGAGAGTGGECPALIFNSMIAETGFPMVFSTVDMPKATARFIDDFYALYPGRDVPITTAARLSATFPYVSPAATADVARGRHAVDGGYYDNYGMATLIAVLDTALRTRGHPQAAPAAPETTNGPSSSPSSSSPSSSSMAPLAPRLSYALPKVLVIEIREAPLGQSAPPKIVEPPTLFERARAGGGSTYQVYGPLQGLFQMRGAAQSAHNETERCLMQGTWASEVDIKTIDFTYPRRDGPLSWHLTEVDKDHIRDVWTTDGEINKRKTAVVEFLTENRWTREVEPCPVGGARPPS
jgi:hypothetical protein